MVGEGGEVERRKEGKGKEKSLEKGRQREESEEGAKGRNRGERGYGAGKINGEDKRWK